MKAHLVTIECRSGAVKHKPQTAALNSSRWRATKFMRPFIGNPLAGQEGQDIAEYTVLLATIQLLVVGTARLIGSTSNTALSTVARFLQSGPSD